MRHEPLLVHAFLRVRNMSSAAAASFTAVVEAIRSLAETDSPPAGPPFSASGSRRTTIAPCTSTCLAPKLFEIASPRATFLRATTFTQSGAQIKPRWRIKHVADAKGIEQGNQTVRDKGDEELGSRHPHTEFCCAAL